MHASISTPSAQKAVGAVLVVGGGVAGVQAALDLTELGLYEILKPLCIVHVSNIKRNQTAFSAFGINSVL